MLESPSHLRLSLVCARGTPVADMLAHSPPLPLIIDGFFDYNEIATEDEQRIALALQHRDRVRRICLRGSESILQRLINSLDGEFPILEYLSIEPKWILGSFGDDGNFPETFRAPHLRHVFLASFDNPIEFPLLATTTGLVTLSLDSIPCSASFDSIFLFQRVSLMPHLEILRIYFEHYHPSQLLRTPIITRVTLPNLRWFGFKGDSAYLEVLLPLVTFPVLEKLQVHFFTGLTFPIPRLQQFMSTMENLWPNTITLTFQSRCVEIMAYPYERARVYTLSVSIDGRRLNRQVASAAQVCRTLRTVFSSVEHLTIKYCGIIKSSLFRVPDRTQWRKLLGSFVNVKTLFMDNDYVRQLSDALQPDEGESPTELLPELQELSCSAGTFSVDVFTPFIDARERAGRPVTLIRV